MARAQRDRRDAAQRVEFGARKPDEPLVVGVVLPESFGSDRDEMTLVHAPDVGRHLLGPTCDRARRLVGLGRGSLSRSQARTACWSAIRTPVGSR